MPLLSFFPSPVMGIWKIIEPWQDMLELFKNKASYANDVLKIHSNNRKREWLAVRLLIKQLTGKEIPVCYKANGAPFLDNSPYYISISHTKGYAAIILSHYPQPGIDIEYHSERAWKLRAKFLNEKELELYDPIRYSTFATLCWCAKETACKALQDPSIDFIKHLHIAPFTISEKGTLFLKETKTTEQKTFLIHYQLTDDYIVTWFDIQK